MTPPYVKVAWNFLLLSPRLVKAILEISIERLFAGRARRLRGLTRADWLAHQLDLAPGRIASAKIEEAHTGTATRSRLEIEYSNAVEGASGPPSLFVKSTPGSFGATLFGVLFGLGGNEVSFYRRIRADLPVRAPQVVFAEGNSNHYVMLLEDLEGKGCDFQTLASRCSLENARSIVSTLARLHGHFWESPRFAADLAWVRRFETDRDYRLLDLVRQLSVPIAFEKYGSVLPDEIREVVPHLMDNYGRLEEKWAEGPRTLLHGDAHLGNMYFQAGEVGLLDWQVVQYGQGMRDVSYLLINSVEKDLRLAHQEELIRLYLAGLSDLGVELDFETAWRQYRLQSVYAWIAGVVTAPSNFQGEAVVAAGLSRASAAVLDLDAVDLIRKL